jgi:integrase
MKHNVKFQLEKRKDKNGLVITNNVPLFADIRFSGTRLFYFTGYRINVSCFNSDEQKAIKNTTAVEGKRKVSYSDINRRIKLIEAALTNLFDNIQAVPDKSTIVKSLDDVCKKGTQEGNDNEVESFEFLQVFDNYINNARLSKGRKNHATSTLNHWKRFAESEKVTLTFEAITAETLRQFEKFLLSEKKTVKEQTEKEIKNKTAKKPTKKDTEGKTARGVNTLHSIFALTRAFWNYAIKELKTKGIILQYPFDSYQIPAEVYGTPIYLTIEERNMLFNAVIENERLTRIRDIFVLQCLTGARVGDLCKFTKDNITDNILSYIPRKTKEGKPVTVTVPLGVKAKELLSRYDMPDGRLMPFITDQRYNEYLKELFELVKLTRIVTRQNSTTREEENVRLCDIASSHMARRCFIGGLFGKVDSAIIASMSGHVTNSKAFARYYDVDKKLQQDAIKLMD